MVCIQLSPRKRRPEREGLKQNMFYIKMAGDNVTELSQNILPVSSTTRAPPGFIIVSISFEEFQFLKIGEAHLLEDRNRKKEYVHQHGLDLIAIAASTSDSMDCQDSYGNAVGMELSPRSSGGNSLLSSIVGTGEGDKFLQVSQIFGRERVISGYSLSPLTNSVPSTPEISTPNSNSRSRAASAEELDMIRQTTTSFTNGKDRKN